MYTFRISLTLPSRTSSQSAMISRTSERGETGSLGQRGQTAGTDRETLEVLQHGNSTARLYQLSSKVAPSTGGGSNAPWDWLLGSPTKAERAEPRPSGGCVITRDWGGCSEMPAPRR